MKKKRKIRPKDISSNQPVLSPVEPEDLCPLPCEDAPRPFSPVKPEARD
jgi:hypothetical protein